jgi:hypothetical protein
MNLNPLTWIDKFINERGSANILRDRIGLLEQEHRAETQKLNGERDTLSEQVRVATAERDLARGELQQTKSELEQARNQILRMTPLTIKAREMAIAAGFRKAWTGSGLVLTLQNKTTKPLALNVTATDSTKQKKRAFRVVVNGGTSQGASFQAAPPKEIGHREGWAFVSGDSVEIECSEYDSMRITVP